MKVQYDPLLLEKLKKLDVRIRKSFEEIIELFKRNPQNSQLNSHMLRNEYEGFISIDITNDYRAIYEEVWSGKDVVAYFFLLGTHKEFYGNKS